MYNENTSPPPSPPPPKKKKLPGNAHNSEYMFGRRKRQQTTKNLNLNTKEDGIIAEKVEATNNYSYEKANFHNLEYNIEILFLNIFSHKIS